MSRKSYSPVEPSEIVKESSKSQQFHQNFWMEFLIPGKWKYSCIFNDLKNYSLHTNDGKQVKNLISFMVTQYSVKT